MDVRKIMQNKTRVYMIIGTLLNYLFKINI